MIPSPSRRAPLRHGAARVAALVLVAGLALAGCTSPSSDLVDDYNAGDAGGDYISGDGAVTTIAPENRGAPVDFGGDTDTGDVISSDDLRGRVVVVNFWYAACPPCRVEAPDLERLHQTFLDDEVSFVGVNVSDQADTARTFAEQHGVTYPSILDVADNSVLLAFAGQVSANAVPTTLVIDREGRVAARFSGIISSPSLVEQIVDETLAEDS